MQLQRSSHRAVGLPIQQLPIAIGNAAGLEQPRVHPRAARRELPLGRGQGQQAGMSTGSVLLKGHRHRMLGITGLGGGQRLAAALPSMHGEGLQRQTAQQQQCRGSECQGQGKALAGKRANQYQPTVD